jgi:hypothetical protein
MRIHFAYPRDAFLRDYEKEYLAMVEHELRQHGGACGLQLAASPAQADILILLQSAQYKTREYIKVLESDPLIRDHAERIYVIDYDDHPEGMLAGLYTSIEAPFYDATLHRSWPILFMNNPFVYDLDVAGLWRRSPTRLFSFVGAASHRVRTQLFELFSSPSADYHVEEIKKWYNHNHSDRRRFLEVGIDSAFCLCPRGYAAYTNRISEVMAMGRAPVIIADDWIPFSFSETLPYYIRVAEKDVEHLPDILAARRDEAQTLGRNARTLWEHNCSKTRRITAAVECVAKLAAQGAKMSFVQYRELWHSKSFLRKAGWTTRQRLALRLEQRVQQWFPGVKVPGVSATMRHPIVGNLK